MLNATDSDSAQIQILDARTDSYKLMLDYNYNYFEKQDLDLEGEEPDIQKKITHLLRP